jgi:hypothetical protein
MFPDGSRRGTISVTAVHADKVPMVPNFGQQPRFIVTIQPPGVRFDPPARISHPNVDGLPPGAVTELYSFDHDMGAFVATATATVSVDGAVLVSDPGTGILKGGWHCGGNPSTSGTAARCKDCWKCTGSACGVDLVQNSRPCARKADDGAKTGVCKDGKCECAVPTNFREVASNGKDGVITFIYAWDSSTGDLADLAQCEVGEYVKYPSEDPEYIFPQPPWSTKVDNPFIRWFSATEMAVDKHHMLNPAGKCAPASVTALQKYRYHCPCKSNDEPQDLIAPLEIVRTVTENADGSFKYTVSKSGVSSSVEMCPKPVE